MPVIKTVRECYEVRQEKPGYEWANITLKCWEQERSGGKPNYGGEIQISSSYGKWSNFWTACATPFKQFLQEIDFHYTFGKFMGCALEEFDGEATVAEVKRHISNSRRQLYLSHEQARDIWEMIDCLGSSLVIDGPVGFGHAMQEIAAELDDNHPMHDYFADPMNWPTCTKPNNAAVRFWHDLWPLFTGELKRETT